jgi:hypothetical protein
MSQPAFKSFINKLQIHNAENCLENLVNMDSIIQLFNQPTIQLLIQSYG